MSTYCDSREVARIVSTSLRISFAVREIMLFKSSGRGDQNAVVCGKTSPACVPLLQTSGQKKDLALAGCFLTVISVGVVENQESNLYAEAKTTHRELESESSSRSPCCE